MIANGGSSFCLWSRAGFKDPAREGRRATVKKARSSPPFARASFRGSLRIPPILRRITHTDRSGDLAGTDGKVDSRCRGASEPAARSRVPGRYRRGKNIAVAWSRGAGVVALLSAAGPGRTRCRASGGLRLRRIRDRAADDEVHGPRSRRGLPPARASRGEGSRGHHRGPARPCRGNVCSRGGRRTAAGRSRAFAGPGDISPPGYFD
jgi:hypothetical protein